MWSTGKHRCACCQTAPNQFFLKIALLNKQIRILAILVQENLLPLSRRRLWNRYQCTIARFCKCMWAAVVCLADYSFWLCGPSRKTTFARTFCKFFVQVAFSNLESRSLQSELTLLQSGLVVGFATRLVILVVLTSTSSIDTIGKHQLVHSECQI